MYNQKESELNPKEPKRNQNHDLAIVSLHFLDQFLSLSFFSFMWCFSWFRKLPMDSNWCFFMPWWSRDHPRLILDRFGKLHFFMKIFIFLTEILRPYFHENSHVHWNPGQSECTQTSSDPIRETILNHQILPSRCWEKQKTKLKRDLNQVTKISRKSSIRGNYSWAYLL